MVTVADKHTVLTSAPIPKAWVLDGQPRARNALLALSGDRTASTLLWDCSAGRFNWFYDQDETIHLLEGSVTLTLQDGRVEQIGPGDIVFFPAGSRAQWEVHSYVRKLAVFRETVPQPVALYVRLRAKLRLWLRTAARPIRAPQVGLPLPA